MFHSYVSHWMALFRSAGVADGARRFHYNTAARSFHSVVRKLPIFEERICGSATHDTHEWLLIEVGLLNPSWALLVAYRIEPALHDRLRVW